METHHQMGAEESYITMFHGNIKGVPLLTLSIPLDAIHILLWVTHQAAKTPPCFQSAYFSLSPLLEPVTKYDKK